MSYIPDNLPWAAIDFETTGLHPGYHHRVVEIGIVTGLGREMQESWSSLICPDRDIGASEIHGLRGADLIHAPRFSDVAGTVLDQLCGRLLVAHNSSFEEAFLLAELRRIEIEPTELDWFCTLRAMSELGYERPRLADCCLELGIDTNGSHSALADATACAQLFVACVDKVERSWSIPSDPKWPVIEVRRGALPRGVTAPSAEPKSLARFVSQLSEIPEVADVRHDGASHAYVELLDRVLEDRKVTSAEADELLACARLLGLGPRDAQLIHERYMAAVLARAKADGKITDREQSDLECLGQLLAVQWGTVSAQGDVDAGRGSALDADSTICFTGALTCSIGDELLTRERAETLAAEAGLVVMPRVTKKLDLLVVADPNSLSGKARKAREYGTRIVAEQSFWAMIDVDVT